MDSLAKAELQLKQAKARVQKLKSKERDRKRKLETRQKILLGAGLLNFQNTPEGKVLLRKILAAMDERNKAIFYDENGQIIAGESTPSHK